MMIGRSLFKAKLVGGPCDGRVMIYSDLAKEQMIVNCESLDDFTGFDIEHKVHDTSRRRAIYVNKGDRIFEFERYADEDN